MHIMPYNKIWHIIRKNNKILFSILLLFTNERDCYIQEIIRLNLVREIGVERNSGTGRLFLGNRKAKQDSLDDTQFGLF